MEAHGLQSAHPLALRKKSYVLNLRGFCGGTGNPCIYGQLNLSQSGRNVLDKSLRQPLCALAKRH